MSVVPSIPTQLTIHSVAVPTIPTIAPGWSAVAASRRALGNAFWINLYVSPSVHVRCSLYRFAFLQPEDVFASTVSECREDFNVY